MDYAAKIEQLERRIERLEEEPTLFLNEMETAVLTGRKSKSMQIDALRTMGLPFFVNGTGHPIVARSTVEGTKEKPPLPKQKWVPNVLKNQDR